MDAARRQLVADVFDAFAHRKRPQDGFWWTEESTELKRYLEGISPRQLTSAVWDACPVPDIFFLPSMKLTMELHFAPAVMALCIEDYDRVGLSTSHILNWFRNEALGSRLYFDPSCRRDFGWGGNRSSRASWPSDWFLEWLYSDMAEKRSYDADDGPWALQQTKAWFLDGFQPAENRYMTILTGREKAVLRRFFGFLQEEHPDEFALHDGLSGRATHAAKAMLDGNSLGDALGATSAAECRYLIDVVDRLERELPGHFPKARTVPLKAALEDYTGRQRGTHDTDRQGAGTQVASVTTNSPGSGYRASPTVIRFGAPARGTKRRCAT